MGQTINLLGLITFILMCVNSVILIVILLLSIKNTISSSKGVNNNGGEIYCPNCCQPYSAALKNCPRCGKIKNK